MTTLFTSESVTEVPPDKLRDRIADIVLDALLRQDPESRCACKVTCEPQLVRVMGEITTRAAVDYESIARQAIREVRYTDPAYGFDADSVRVEVSLRRQSPDIVLGVDLSMESKTGGAVELGAGDQGITFGFACDETESLMPLPIELAHTLTARLALVRRAKPLSYLRPDGKAQVTVEYRDGRPARVHTIVLSAQHDPIESMDALRRDILEHVIRPVIPAALLDDDTCCYINPTGRFVLGGPAVDTGLTGRKIIVAPHGMGIIADVQISRRLCRSVHLTPESIIAELKLRRPTGTSAPTRPGSPGRKPIWPPT